MTNTVLMQDSRLKTSCLFNVLIGKKDGIRDGDTRRYGKRDSTKKRAGIRSPSMGSWRECGIENPPPSPSRFPYLLISPSQIPFFSPISTLKRQVFVQKEMNVRFRLAPAIDILNLSYCFKKKIKLFVPQYDERARYDNCMGRPVRLWAVLERKYRNGLDLVFVGGTVLIVAGV